MTVTDHIHSTELTFGTNENGTDGYDDGLDQYAPPSPPSSDVFDARFVWEGNDFIKDIMKNHDVESLMDNNQIDELIHTIFKNYNA